MRQTAVKTKSLMLQEGEFQIFQPFKRLWYSNEEDKRHRLGELYESNLCLENFGICRRIEKGFTNYVLDDFFKELHILNIPELRPHLVNVIGYHIKDR